MRAPFLNLKRLLIKNTGIQLVAHTVAIVVSLTTTFILSRYLGVVRFGGLNYVFAFYYFFLTLVDLGVDIVVVRECSQQPDETVKIISAMRTFKLGTALLSVTIAWITISLVQFPAGLKTPLYLYGLVLPLIALEMPAIIFQINLNAVYPAIIAIGKALANFIFLVALIASGFGMTGYVLALVLSEAATACLILFLGEKYVKLNWVIDFGIWKKILKSSLVIGSTGIFVAVINRIDFIMLERIKDLYQVGLYTAVYKVTNLLEALPLMMMATLYPLMSRFARENRSELFTLYKKTLMLFSAIGLPLGIGVSFFSPMIIRIFFGGNFMGAAAGLRVLIWATVFLYLALSGGNVLISLGREKISFGINATAAILNVALNFFLIPRYGFVGAAWATVCAFGFIFIGTTGAAWKILRTGLPESPAKTL